MYAIETKTRIINQYQNGASVKELALENHISKSTLYSWISKASTSSSLKSGLSVHQIHSIQCNQQRLKQYNEIYITTGITPLSPIKERLALVDKLDGQYSLNVLLDALKISKSTYYSHKIAQEKMTNHDVTDEYCKQVIAEEFKKAKGRYGSKKIHVKLAKKGIIIGENRISRLMAEMGLSCVTQKPSRWTSPSYQRYRKNKLNRHFDQVEPNKVWISDFTYIKMKNYTFFYICAIMDLFSRKIISYHVSENIDTQTLIYTFDNAYTSRNCPTDLMFHSDQGVQYTSYQFISYLRDLGVTQSLSKPGCPYDNSVMESFFATLKKESLFREKYHNLNELKAIIDEYILFYNSDRPHYKLKMMTPDEFEQEYYNHFG